MTKCFEGLNNIWDRTFTEELLAVGFFGFRISDLGLGFWVLGFGFFHYSLFIIHLTVRVCFRFAMKISREKSRLYTNY